MILKLMQHLPEWRLRATAHFLLALLIVAVLLPPLADTTTSLRTLESQPPYSELYNLTLKVGQSSGFARTAASDARAVSSEVMARLAADAAEGAQMNSKTDKDNTENRERFFAGAAEEGKKQENLAAVAVVAAKEALEAGKIWQKDVVKQAAAYAAKTVQERLAPTFKGLQDWKYQVLHDPVSEAHMAAQKAAAPYEKAMRTLEGRIAEMSQRATGLQSQAYALQNEAKGMADGAVALQAAKDFKNAQTEMMNAHQMMAQASLFGAQATKIQMAIEPLEVPLPAYSAAAQAAAASAAHRYNAEGYAPPPVSGKAFNPPPPPTPIFLQRWSEVHRINGPLEPAIGGR